MVIVTTKKGSGSKIPISWWRTSYSVFCLEVHFFPPVWISPPMHLNSKWCAYYILKLPSWSHFVPISFWNPQDIDWSDWRRNFPTSGCYLYYINLQFPVANNVPIGEAHFLLLFILHKSAISGFPVANNVSISEAHCFFFLNFERNFYPSPRKMRKSPNRVT